MATTDPAAGPQQAALDAGQRAYRLTAIDALRGLAIVLMALDQPGISSCGHRHGSLANPTYLSHFRDALDHAFCAPVFVLLAGTSAGLMAARKSRGELARSCHARRVAHPVESVVATAWTFSPRGIAQVGGLTWTSLQ